MAILIMGYLFVSMTFELNIDKYGLQGNDLAMSPYQLLMCVV
jgi:hypothetical protein